MAILTSHAGYPGCLTGIDECSKQYRLQSAAVRRVSWDVIGGCAEPRMSWGILILALSRNFRLGHLADAGDVLQTVLPVQGIHRVSRTGPI
jgi:hypothetical protein